MPATSGLSPTFSSVYASRRMFVLASLGVVSGLPYLVATDTIAAWLSDIGRDVKAIGLFALITLPYTFKFLWAPLLDRFRLPGLGRRRGWLISFQILLTMALAGIALVGPTDPTSPLLPLAVLGISLVFLSASFDIVSSAYLVDVCNPRERGAGAAMFVSGYRIAFVAAGAGMLILAERAGWRAAIASAAALMGALTLFTIIAPEPESGSTPRSIADAVVQPVIAFARDFRWGFLVIIAFVLLFRLPDQLATRMTMPLLIQDLKFTPEQVGWIRQAFGFGITIIGAIIGGGVIARMRMTRSLLLFGMLQALSNAGFLLLASLPASLWLLAAVVGVENFCNGLVSAGFVAFLMGCCDHRYSATQYALLSGVMAGAGSLAQAVSGYLVGEEAAYVRFFTISIVTGLPGILLIPLLPRRRVPPPRSCAVCEYDLTGNTTATCPECGTAVTNLSAADDRPFD